MYTALYRKWRPLTFDDVVSQPHITKTLSRQIQEGKTAHAYLFTGSRGTGKTTCARIFAKAINCLNPHDGEPCLECEICRTADEGMLNDIIEIDAASNTGVDDIRDLRESTVYTPELCKYKVYIIDEVHMLSNQAFNALLKIMEEPPKYIKFILATTEIHKVPATVVSRCQRFDFRRIRQEDIVARLTYISEQEGATLSPEAASLIARLSDGAMRDALSLLDRCMAFTNEITAETVSEAAGVAGRDYLFRLLNAFADKNASEALNITDDLYSKSKDMHRLCDELVFQLRNLMLIKTAPENKQLLDCLPSEVGELEALAKKLTLTEVLDKLSILQQSGEAMQRAVSKRTELETAFIRICSATASNSVDTQVLLRKIDRLEQEILELKANGVKVLAPEQTAKPNNKPQSAVKPTQPAPTPANTAPAEIFAEWNAVLDRLLEVSPGCSAALVGSRGVVSGNRLLVEVKNEFSLGLLKKPENVSALQAVVKEITGKVYSVGAKCVKEQEVKNNEIEKLIEKAKKEDIPFDIE